MSDTYGVKEVADVTIFDLSGKPFLFLDTLKMTTVENTAETVDSRGGRGNSKLLSWDYNRDANVQMQDALMSMKSLSLLTGNNVVTGVANVHKREVAIAVAGTSGATKVVLENAPIKSTVSVFKLNDQATIVEFTDVSLKEITFSSTKVTAGDQIVVYYQFASTDKAETITISADKFPPYVKVVGDTVIRNAKTGVDEPFQMVIHKAKINPNFTLTFQADGDPSVFDMNLTVYRRNEDSDMITYIKYNTQ